MVNCLVLFAARKGDAPQRDGVYHGGDVVEVGQGRVLYQVNADFVKPIGQLAGVGTVPIGAKAGARAKGDDVEVENVRGIEEQFADKLDLWMKEFHVLCVLCFVCCVSVFVFGVLEAFMGQR